MRWVWWSEVGVDVGVGVGVGIEIAVGLHEKCGIAGSVRCRC